MKLSEYKKWQVEKYYKRTRLYWSIVFGIHIFIGLLVYGLSGGLMGAGLSLMLLLVEGMVVGTHPEQKDDESWNISSDRFL